MQIYNPNNQLIIDTEVDDASFRFKKVMADDTLNLYFSLDSFIEIPEGSYCSYKSERYTLMKSQEFTQQHSEHYDYSLQFEGTVGLLKTVKYKFFTVIRDPGQPVKDGSSQKVKFSLTAAPEDFIQLVVDCMNLKEGANNWSRGECIASDPVTLDFNHDYCYDAIVKMAQAFETEFEVQNKVIHLRKVERYDAQDNRIAFDLSYGYNNGILGGIRRTQYDNSKIVNIVLIDGGDRNINRATYGRDRDPAGSDTLLLAKSKTITHEGIDYISDASGSYIRRVNLLPGAEDSLDVSKVYPHRVGYLTTVDPIEEDIDTFSFVDINIPDDLDYSQMRIAGEKATIIFQSGDLAGQEFDIVQTDKEMTGYIHAERRFKLIKRTDSGLTTPAGAILPREGDKYGVFHISLPQSYIDDAENEALKLAAQYLYENEQPKYTYRWTLDELYAKREWAVIGDYLNIGYFVRFSSPLYQPEPVDIRITSVKEFINKPKSPTIEIANNISPMSPRNQLNQLPTLEQTIDRKNKNAMDRAKSIARSQEEYEYLRIALANNTEIDGGLILTSLIKLGAILGEEWVERAGISGASGAPEAVAFWAGGNLTDAINNLAAIILRMDGSGQLAKGNILWNALGELSVTGKFESSKAGRRIVIDPDGSFSMYVDGRDQPLYSVFFANEIGAMVRIDSDNYLTTLYEWGLDVSGKSNDILDRYSAIVTKDQFQVTYAGIDNEEPISFSARVESGLLRMRMQGLPISPDNLGENELWRNNNLIQIKPPL
ncbi:MAG: hypothetical protein LBU84_16935 [Prevotella sp.]|jgi:hypothetical protein|nr:hypothetical protein [Prevotella sp.]